jgi:hypothetical protein
MVNQTNEVAEGDKDGFRDVVLREKKVLGRRSLRRLSCRSA